LVNYQGIVTDIMVSDLWVSFCDILLCIKNAYEIWWKLICSI